MTYPHNSCPCILSDKYKNSLDEVAHKFLHSGMDSSDLKEMKRKSGNSANPKQTKRRVRFQGKFPLFFFSVILESSLAHSTQYLH